MGLPLGRRLGCHGDGEGVAHGRRLVVVVDHLLLVGGLLVGVVVVVHLSHCVDVLEVHRGLLVIEELHGAGGGLCGKDGGNGASWGSTRKYTKEGGHPLSEKRRRGRADNGGIRRVRDK